MEIISLTFDFSATEVFLSIFTVIKDHADGSGEVRWVTLLVEAGVLSCAVGTIAVYVIKLEFNPRWSCLVLFTYFIPWLELLGPLALKLPTSIVFLHGCV